MKKGNLPCRAPERLQGLPLGRLPRCALTSLRHAVSLSGIVALSRSRSGPQRFSNYAFHADSDCVFETAMTPPRVSRRPNCAGKDAPHPAANFARARLAGETQPQVWQKAAGEHESRGPPAAPSIV